MNKCKEVIKSVFFRTDVNVFKLSTMTDLNKGGLSPSEIMMTKYRFALIKNGVMVVARGLLEPRIFHAVAFQITLPEDEQFFFDPESIAEFVKKPALATMAYRSDECLTLQLKRCKSDRDAYYNIRNLRKSANRKTRAVRNQIPELLRRTLVTW